MSMRKGAAPLLVALVAILAIAVPSAVAASFPGQVVNVSTKLWIADVGTQGKVRAGNPNCVEGREVLVKANGIGTVARATANANGVWKVKRGKVYPKLELPAKLYAVAPQVYQGTAGTIYNCRSAVSRTVKIPASAAGPGQVVRVNSKLWIADVGTQGRVRAANPNCVADREVLIKANGQGEILKTTADAEGLWKVDANELYSRLALPAKVYAVVPQEYQGTAGPIYRCVKAISRTVDVG
ncbi:MAG: hypothetical protein R2725_03000 [Solirubrobacterales bacterium]